MPSRSKRDYARFAKVRDRERELLAMNALQTADCSAVASLFIDLFFLLSETFETSPQRVRYWLKRFLSPTPTHSHGGCRHEKFSKTIRNVIRIALWDIVQQFPLGTVPFFTGKLEELGFGVSVSDVRAIFNAWNWSWKIPGVIQLLKYTPENLEYYFTFAVAIRYVPLIKMKWLDEAHIKPSHLMKGSIVVLF